MTAHIATSAEGAADVHVADMDGDGDLILSFFNDDRLPGMKIMGQPIPPGLQLISHFADGA